MRLVGLRSRCFRCYCCCLKRQVSPPGRVLVRCRAAAAPTAPASAAASAHAAAHATAHLAAASVAAALLTSPALLAAPSTGAVTTERGRFDSFAENDFVNVAKNFASSEVPRAFQFNLWVAPATDFITGLVHEGSIPVVSPAAVPPVAAHVVASPAAAHAVPAAHAVAAAPAAHAAPAAAAHPEAARSVLDGDLLDLDVLATHVDAGLLKQHLGRLLLVVRDEAEVLGLVLAPVNGPLQLHHVAVLHEVLLDLIVGDGDVGELADVDLTLKEAE